MFIQTLLFGLTCVYGMTSNAQGMAGPEGHRPQGQPSQGHSSGDKPPHHGLNCRSAIPLSPDKIAYTQRDYQIIDKYSLLLVYVIFFPNDTHNWKCEPTQKWITWPNRLTLAIIAIGRLNVAYLMVESMVNTMLKIWGNIRNICDRMIFFLERVLQNSSWVRAYFCQRWWFDAIFASHT